MVIFVIKNHNFFYPYTIASINNELFITDNNGIYKTNKSLNILKSYIRTSSGYKGIFHNQTADIIYVANFYSNRTDLFYRNLTFISSINLENSPMTLTEKNGKIYVGLNDGTISVIENNLVVKTITTLCTGRISSIVIDANESMGVLCLTNSILYLYSKNGSYTGKSMTTPSSPRFFNYDLNGNFIIAGQSQINLYY